jgi:hypothetical protein
MTTLSDETIAFAFAKSARDNLGVEININEPDGMEALVATVLNEPDVARVRAFVASLEAAGVKWEAPASREMRPIMEYRVYEMPAEVGKSMCNDEPSVGRNLSLAMRRQASLVASDASSGQMVSSPKEPSPVPASDARGDGDVSNTGIS